MITLKNQSLHPYFLDSDTPYEIKTRRPPSGLVNDTIEGDDRLEIKTGQDLVITILDDTIVIRRA